MSNNLTPWQEFKKNLGDARPWHLLIKENYVSDKIAEERFSICVQCPFFTKLKTCKKCGCAMRQKTKVKSAQCPINKWDRVY